jgi:hypothetical protein
MGLRLDKPGALVRFGVASTLLAAGLAFASPSRADEPRKTNEPYVLNEPTEFTQVVDAFDEGDPFDLHLTLGYQHTWNQAKIRRETSMHNGPGQHSNGGLTTGGYTSDNLNIAEYNQTVSRLNTRADIGIYKDIALVLRMPIILSDSRELRGLDGSASQQGLVLQGYPGEQLFKLPFTSPKRSGIEYLAVGIDFGIFNQYRDPTKPTWIAGFEARFSVSEPMRACDSSPAAGQEKCAYPSDVDRDGDPNEYPAGGGVGNLEGSNFSGGRDPGVSRGTTGLEVHSFMSRRIKYIEPYGGFRALFEFASGSSEYGKVDLKGSLVNHPPLRGSLFFGLSVIPWEIRDQFQRVTIDMRFTGTYVSEGRDYSELFDALGSSPARSLRSPTYSAYQHNPVCNGGADGTQCIDPDGAGPLIAPAPSVVNPSSQKVYFTGLTDVQQHGVYSFSSQFTWQAGEYVKFNIGGQYTFTQAHLITFDQACNPDFANDIGASGPCLTGDETSGTRTATGIPNPNYRAVINTPGRRFKVEDSLQIDAWVNATVMF